MDELDDDFYQRLAKLLKEFVTSGKPQETSENPAGEHEKAS